MILLSLILFGQKVFIKLKNTIFEHSTILEHLTNKFFWSLLCSPPVRKISSDCMKQPEEDLGSNYVQV